MTEPITITEDLLHRLWVAQMEHTKNQIDHSLVYFSDDGYDYLCAALNLCEVLTDIYYETNLALLQDLLNTPSVIASDNHYQKWEEFEADHRFPMLETYAGDGVCPALYDLNCPALPKED